MTKPISSGEHSSSWPKNTRYDAALLRDGDSRNVVNKYRYWTVKAIKQDLDDHRRPLEIAIENVERDFNMGTIVRTANAFNVRTVHIIGKKQWNKRGAMMTDTYMNIAYHSSADVFVKATVGYTLIAVDIVPGAIDISSETFPEQTILMFGSEGNGLSQKLLETANRIVKIEQQGSTRSINVGVAAGIAMYMWLLQHPLKR